MADAEGRESQVVNAFELLHTSRSGSDEKERGSIQECLRYGKSQVGWIRCGENVPTCNAAVKRLNLRGIKDVPCSGSRTSNSGASVPIFSIQLPKERTNGSP